MNITSPNPFEPLPIDAPLNRGPGVLDHALANPEPQRIPLNNFARPLDTVGRKQKHQSTQTNAQL